MTEFLHLENKLYITVIVKDKYTRFEFCKAVTYGIFREVCLGGWKQGRRSLSDCESNVQGHT
jgi:hypothetical protein